MEEEQKAHAQNKKLEEEERLSLQKTEDNKRTTLIEKPVEEMKEEPVQKEVDTPTKLTKQDSHIVAEDKVIVESK